MEEILLKLRRLTQQVKDSSSQTITDLKPTIETIKTSIDQKLGNSTDVELDKTIFGKLAEIKKISGERRAQLAAKLTLMDIAGLTQASTAKQLADSLDTIPINAKEAAILTTQGQTRKIPRGYHKTGGTVKANITNLTSSNIKDGVNVGGVIGTYRTLATLEPLTGQDNQKVTKTYSGTIVAIADIMQQIVEWESKPIGFRQYLGEYIVYGYFVDYSEEVYNNSYIEKRSNNQLYISTYMDFKGYALTVKV